MSERFSGAVRDLAAQPLPADVAHAARIHLSNVLALGIAASGRADVDAVVTVGTQAGGAPVSPVLGRRERLDPVYSALANGLAAHLDDYDDTHLETVIHPSAASMATALAIGSSCGATGSETLTAFAVGCEVQLRIGRTFSPWHYDAGWHITGTCGVLGAATTAALLLGLDAPGMNRAWGIAASETVGQREAFGTSIKPLHAGKAAANGILAAQLAARGFSSSERVLEAARGFFNVLSPNAVPERLLGDFGARWDFLDDVIKPYPCGIVIHPLIDAAIELSPTLRSLDRVTKVVVRCNPLVADLTGNPDPKTGLQARFSGIHGVAAGLADGRVGLAQFSDERVTSPDVTRLRSLCQLQVDEGTARDAASVDVELDDSVVLTASVAHARGSLKRPMSDDEVEEKIRELIEPVLPGRTDAIVQAVADLGDAPDLVALSEACVVGERVGLGTPREQETSR